MLSHEIISKQLAKVACSYPVKRLAYFGSYATGKQTEESDLDVLVEFLTPSVSLITISDMRLKIEESLNISVDLIHAPLPKDSFIEIGKVVSVYEQ